MLNRRVALRLAALSAGALPVGALASGLPHAASPPSHPGRIEGSVFLHARYDDPAAPDRELNASIEVEVAPNGRWSVAFTRAGETDRQHGRVAGGPSDPALPLLNRLFAFAEARGGGTPPDSSPAAEPEPDFVFGARFDGMAVMTAERLPAHCGALAMRRVNGVWIALVDLATRDLLDEWEAAGAGRPEGAPHEHFPERMPRPFTPE